MIMMLEWFGKSAALISLLAATAASAGPAGGLTREQQRQTLERVVLVCENDPSILCPGDREDPGYQISGNQFGRIYHQACAPDFSKACIPLVVAERSGTLTLAATELAPAPTASCAGSPSCIGLQIDVGLSVPGSSASVSIARSFAHPTGFLTTSQCQDDNLSPGVRISDWFPFRSRDCVFSDGINFEGMLVPSNDPYAMPDGVAGNVDPKLVFFQTALQQYAWEELGIPAGSVLPVTLLAEDDPAKGLAAGNAVRLDPADLFDGQVNGATRSGSYPVIVRYAVARRPDGVEADLFLGGVASGGTLTVVVRGIFVTTPTSSGAPAASVAEQLRAAIAADATLATLGVSAVATAAGVTIAGALNDDVAVTTTDAGLVAYVATGCSNGSDDDGDGSIDYPDDMGCAGPDDPSERSPLLPCDNGLDDDGDGLHDHPGDPGCADTSDGSERAAALVCDDGIDNDGDGAIDFPADAGCASPNGVSERPPLRVTAVQNASSCAFDQVGGNAFLYYAFGFPPCGGAQGSIRSRFDAKASSESLSETEVRLRVQAASASDVEPAYNPSYNYLASGLHVAFELTVDVPAGQQWTVDLASVARGAVVTYDDPDAGNALATLEGAVAPFNVTVGPYGFPFTMPPWTTYFSTGQGPASSCIPFEAARSDASALSGTGPGTFSVQVASVLRTYSGGNEGAILFGVDDVLPNYYESTTADNYASSPNSGCSGRVAADDGYDLTVTLHLPSCANGLDDDGDGGIDFPADAGCADANDGSERAENLACDDGADNDQDGLADFPNDPGCQTATGSLENPKCDDDLDNDGDGKIDADGGVLGAAPDPQCAGQPWKNRERANCGLGAELTLVLALLRLARRRA